MKQLVSSLLLGACLALLAVPAYADTLDDYLIPMCGVTGGGMEEFQAQLDERVSDLQARFGEEILARGQSSALAAYDMHTAQLMWLVGTMRSEAGRLVAAEVVTTGNRDYRGKVLGGIGMRPDWAGVEILLIGAGNADPLTRDTAIAVLADTIDFNTPVFATPDAAERRAATLATLQMLHASETEDYLRGKLGTAIGKLELTLSSN